MKIYVKSENNQLVWSLRVSLNVIDLGKFVTVQSSDDTIRPTVTKDLSGNKMRHIEEEQRYYKLLVEGAEKYIKDKAKQYPDFVEYFDTQSSTHSVAGYVFFTINEDTYSVDLRVAEVEYTDKYNTVREDAAVRKLNNFKSKGIISKDSTLLLEDIIISTEDSERKFDDYSSAIEYMKSEIDKLLNNYYQLTCLKLNKENQECISTVEL